MLRKEGLLYAMHLTASLVLQEQQAGPAEERMVGVTWVPWS